MEHMPVRVVRKALEAQDIASFELAHPEGAPLPAFEAGAHIKVQVPGGLARHYSLCNDPAEQHRYRIAVLRDAASRGGSAAMHDAVREGDLLHVSRPRNHFPLQATPRTLLLAGGIGVTPLLAMAHRLAADGADFELHYCTRNAARTAFRDEIAASVFAHRVHFHFDDGPPSQRLHLARVLAAPVADARLYVCGPTGFIEHVVTTAKDHGWPQAQIHLEYFGAAPLDHSAEAAFEVKIASTGRTCAVGPGQNVVEALRAHGIEIMTSCEQGVCGTCLTGVLQGTPDHRDLYLTDEEHAANDRFTPCCSRSRSPLLVLDL